MNGDGDKTTRQSCNLNGDEPKGIRKGALFAIGARRHARREEKGWRILEEEILISRSDRI